MITNPIWYGIAVAIGGFIGPFIVPSTRIFNRRISEIESNLADVWWDTKNACAKVHLLEKEIQKLKGEY